MLAGARPLKPDYSIEALLKARERSAELKLLDGGARKTAPVAPVGAEVVEPWRTVHVWNGERFLPYDTWLPSAVCAMCEVTAPAIPAEAARVVGDCGEVRVLLVQEPGRWLMYVRTGSRKRATRRNEFASPYLAHALQTAEAWYGVPADGWRAEKTDGKQTEDLPSQAERGLDGLAVDGQ